MLSLHSVPSSQWAEADFILLHEGLDFKCDFVQFKSQRKNSTENVTAHNAVLCTKYKINSFVL